MSVPSSTAQAGNNLLGDNLVDWINQSDDFAIDAAHDINQASWSGTGDNTYHFDRFQFKQPTEGITRFYNSFRDRIRGPLLDIACAGGHNLAYLAGKSINPLYGIDISRPYIERARESLPDATFRIADMLNIPFEDRMFNTILARGIYHNTTTKGFLAALKESYRLLKPGGIIYIRRRYKPKKFDGLENPSLFTFLEFDKGDDGSRKPSMVRNFMPVPQIRSLIESVGFRFVDQGTEAVVSHLNNRGETRYCVEYVCTR